MELGLELVLPVPDKSNGLSLAEPFGLQTDEDDDDSLVFERFGSGDPREFLRLDDDDDMSMDLFSLFVLIFGWCNLLVPPALLCCSLVC